MSSTFTSRSGSDARTAFSSFLRLAILAISFLALATASQAAPQTFNISGTFADGSSFGAGSAITLDLNNLTSSGVSNINLTLTGANPATFDNTAAIGWWQSYANSSVCSSTVTVYEVKLTQGGATVFLDFIVGNNNIVPGNTGVHTSYSPAAGGNFALTSPTCTGYLIPLVTAVNVSSSTLTVGTAATAFTPVTASGGVGTLSYSIAPALPAGLSMSSSTGTISGTPTVAAAATTYTVTVSDQASPVQTSAKGFSLTVNQASQTIVFTSTPPSNPTVGSTYTVSATGGASGNAVTFAIASGSTSGACTIAASVVTFTGAGTCIIAAAQAGNANYQAATAQQTITVQQASSSISFSSSSTSIMLGQLVTFTASVTPSAAAGTIDVKDDTGILCSATLVGGTATCSKSFGSGGSRQIRATYNGSAQFAAATSATVTVTVTDQTAKTVQTISRFMARRNDLIASNSFDGRRQIDRLEQFSAGAGGADVGRSGSIKDGHRTFADTGLSSFHRDSRMLQGDRLPSMAARTDDDTGRRGGGLPIMLQGDTDAGSRFSFSTSLSQVLRNQAEKESEQARQALGLDAGLVSAAALPRTPFDLWVEGRYATFGGLKTASLDGNFGLFTIGADYVVSSRLLVGAYVQLDRMTETDKTALTRVQSQGWMVGPYFTTRLLSNVYWQGRAGWGRSNVDVSPYQTYTDSFATERRLASTQLTGLWHFGPWTFSPAAAISYLTDKSDSYADTFGALIPSVTATLGQAKAGPELAYRFVTPAGAVIEPHGKAEVIWNFRNDTSANGFVGTDRQEATFSDARGRLELGVRAAAPGGVVIDVVGSYDGVGSAYNVVGGKAEVHIPFGQ